MGKEIKDGRRTYGVIERLRDERGATLALVALGSVVLIGCAAIAIDLGMLLTAKTEGQRVADAAAHSGAVALARHAASPKVIREEEARESAKETAAANDILGDSYDGLRDEDVTFPEPHKVRAVVYRNTARNNPLGTFFARILGFDEVDMAVDATAAVFIGGAAECALPIALPDRWTEAVDTKTWPTLDDTFDPDDTEDDGTDQYVSWDEDADQDFYTGYDDESAGFEVKLRTSGGGHGEFNPSWYGVYRLPDGSGSGSAEGTRAFKDAVTGDACDDEEWILRRGQDVDTEPGNFPKPTRDAFNELINRDSDATWDDSCKCVMRNGEPVVNSPRIRALPLFDPTAIPDPGKKPFTITNFVSIFVDRVEGTDYVVGRLLGLTGFESTGIPGIGEDVPGIKAIQIVE
jgi:hypothetical protein